MRADRRGAHQDELRGIYNAAEAIITCSSSLDHPEDDGAPADFDGRAVIQQALTALRTGCRGCGRQYVEQPNAICPEVVHWRAWSEEQARLLAASHAAHITVRTDNEALRRGLQKIGEIRDSIIGLQKFNWSEHGYPLVAALDAAGFTGTTYENAQKNVGTLLERTNAAEAEVAVLQAKLSEQFDSDVNVGHTKFLLEKEIARLAGILRANVAGGDRCWRILRIGCWHS